MSPPIRKEPELARGWTVSRVQQSLDSADKHSLLLFIGDRYRERFFEPIKRLMESPGHLHGYGFAIMALCSLLIESLQCFRYGLPTTHEAEYRGSLKAFSPAGIYHIAPAEHRSGRQAFEEFFALDIHAALFPGVDGNIFYASIRNGLLHQAQTRDGWRIRSGEPMLWNAAERIVDRTKFANALRRAFEKYVEQLHTAPWDDPLWLKATRKIWWLVQLSSPDRPES